LLPFFSHSISIEEDEELGALLEKIQREDDPDMVGQTKTPQAGSMNDKEKMDGEEGEEDLYGEEESSDDQGDLKEYIAERAAQAEKEKKDVALDEAMDKMEQFREQDDDDEDSKEEEKKKKDDLPPSKFEIAQEKLKEEIQKIEKEMLKDKPWQMVGEVEAHNRPQDSLLEEALDFDRTGAPPPLITPQYALNLEEMITERCKHGIFDDVVLAQVSLLIPFFFLIVSFFFFF